MYKYHFIAKAVAPKRAMLKKAEEELGECQEKLEAAQDKLREVQDKIAQLEADFNWHAFSYDWRRWGDPALAEALRASRLEEERRVSAEKRALLDAAKSGNLGSMRSLLARSSTHLNAKVDGRWSVLHHYAHSGNMAGARLLLEMRADPDPVGSDGKTPAEVASDSALSGLLHERAPLHERVPLQERAPPFPFCRALEKPLV